MGERRGIKGETKTADPARSAAFSVYMSVKNTLLS